tara:strand:+ start:1234 stop:2109 length:876 start_codon:yes stop_codon:yes gene_type:complete
MSTEVNKAFAQKFRDTFLHLVQQKGSRLRDYVRVNTDISGKYDHFDRIGSTSAQKITSRHSDTPLISTPHSRRRVSMDDYNWADLIDKADKVRMLADPASDYMKAGVWAMGRKIDDIIIAAMSGNAVSIDEDDASSNVALPSAQKVAVSATTDMNITKLMQAKKILDASDVDPDLPRHIVMKSNQFYDLLGDTQIQSSDYNTVKALVAGDIDTFMGFKFHRSERLAVDSSSDTLCLAWIPEGIGLSMGMDVKTEISERPDKNYSTQVYAQMCLGAVRIEDEKVVEIACTDS